MLVGQACCGAGQSWSSCVAFLISRWLSRPGRRGQFVYRAPVFASSPLRLTAPALVEANARDSCDARFSRAWASGALSGVGGLWWVSGFC